MNEDAAAERLSETTVPLSELPESGAVESPSVLDYRSRVRADEKPAGSHSEAMIWGLFCGFVVPLSIALEFRSPSYLYLLWGAWIVVCLVVARLLRRRLNTHGYMTGFVIGALSLGGCCGLLTSLCGKW